MVKGLIISKISKSEIDEAAGLLARVMSSNPNHLAIFISQNPKAIKRQTQMFQMVLKNPSQETFVAKIDGKIVGVMSYTNSDCCQTPVKKVLMSLPKLIRMFGSHFMHVLIWRNNWSKHDCKQKHIHFGPIAIDTSYQGLGVGKACLSYFCKYLDDTGQIGYLETDKFMNMKLYEKYGFETVATDYLFGVENWFMLRNNNTQRK